MGKREPEVVTLIRLRQGSLPPADGLRLREELAMDEGIRAKWRLLGEQLETGSTVGLPVDVPAETVAGFVDGRLDESAAAIIEARCWSDPALLREAAAACEARYPIGDAAAVPSERFDTIAVRGGGSTRNDGLVPRAFRRTERIRINGGRRPDQRAIGSACAACGAEGPRRDRRGLSATASREDVVGRCLSHGDGGRGPTPSSTGRDERRGRDDRPAGARAGTGRWGSGRSVVE